MDFKTAERSFAFLRQQLESGQITQDDFVAKVNELRLSGPDGVWWQIAAADGSWMRWDGVQWDQATPHATPSSRKGLYIGVAIGCLSILVLGVLIIVASVYLAVEKGETEHAGSFDSDTSAPAPPKYEARKLQTPYGAIYFKLNTDTGEIWSTFDASALRSSGAPQDSRKWGKCTEPIPVSGKYHFEIQYREGATHFFATCSESGRKWRTTDGSWENF